MGITIDEVESATKIRHKYLAALEADDWQLLPSEIVGRGFLRNYASYLDLDPNEMIERRRALADAGLARVLRNTSAVTPLPPERRVDYRPKEVELKDEPEGLDEIANQQRRRRRRPFLGWMLLWGLLLVLFLWQARNIGAFFGGVAEGVQSGIASIFEPEPLLVPIPDGRSINVNAVSDGAIISNTAQQASGAVEGQGVAGQGVAGQNAANQSGAGQITVGEVLATIIMWRLNQ